MANEKCYIYKVRTKTTPDGYALENEQLTVQGDNLKECRKHFDDLWGKEK